MPGRLLKKKAVDENLTGEKSQNEKRFEAGQWKEEIWILFNHRDHKEHREKLIPIVLLPIGNYRKANI